MNTGKNRTTRKIAMLVYPGANSIDVSGPLQVFHTANELYKKNHKTTEQLYVPIIIGLDDEPVTISAGLTLLPDTNIKSFNEQVDTLFIAGGEGARKLVNNRSLIVWLQQMSGKVRRLASICTGAFLLSATGLLNGRRATTHWRYSESLAQKYPDIDVQADAIYIADNNIYSSAGVTAGMDLALALLEQDINRELALDVARELVLFLKRPGGQSQFSALLVSQQAELPVIDKTINWITQHLHEDLSIERLAQHAAMSSRHFSRVFTREAGIPPARYIECLRVEAARRQLEETGNPLSVIAQRVGFGHVETMRRLFLKHLKVGPRAYRQRFC